MRKAEFNVPSEVMAEFTDAMLNRGLSNAVAGTTEEGEIVIEVTYDRDETEQVDELEGVLETLRSELENEEEEEQ